MFSRYFEMFPANQIVSFFDKRHPLNYYLEAALECLMDSVILKIACSKGLWHLLQVKWARDQTFPVILNFVLAAPVVSLV